MTVVLFDVGNQRLIEHEAVDEAVVERFERHVARAEVIERQPHAEFAQSGEGLEFGRALANDVAIADLELDAARVDCRVFKRFRDGVDEALVHELLRRQVDRDRQVR